MIQSNLTTLDVLVQQSRSFAWSQSEADWYNSNDVGIEYEVVIVSTQKINLLSDCLTSKASVESEKYRLDRRKVSFFLRLFSYL